jgi:hypothetical protein
MKGKYRKEIIALLIVLPIIAYLGIDWHKLTQKRIHSVTVDGKKVSLSGVRVEKIPRELYDLMKDKSPNNKFFIGTKKRIVLFTLDSDTCSRVVAFTRYMDKALKNPVIKENYTIEVADLRPILGIDECDRPLASYCPYKWIPDNCLNNICIFNPRTQEVIVSDSNKYSQLIPLAAAYANWGGYPLAN